MRRTILFLVLFIVALICNGCGKSSSEPAPATEVASAIEPSAMQNGTNGGKNAEKTEDAPFSILVKNAFMFDASSDIFTRNLTQEKGICLLAVGSVRNDSKRIFHRGGLFASLTAKFGKDVTIKKHSTGLGFVPEVSSENPWRPGTWREFRLITRALDPIYIEYVPEDLETEIIVEVRDPLKYSHRTVLTVFRLPWRPIIGSGVEGSAAMIETVTPLNFEKPGTRRFSPGDLVRVVFQKGAGYKVLNDNDIGGWVPYRSLRLDLEDFKLLPARTAPQKVSLADMNVQMTKFKVIADPESEQAKHTAYLRITNKFEGKDIQVRAVDFNYDFGPIDAPSGKLEILKDGKYKNTTGMAVKPGKTESFKYYADYANSKIPLELIWWQASKRRISIPLQ